MAYIWLPVDPEAGEHGFNLHPTMAAVRKAGSLRGKHWRDERKVPAPVRLSDLAAGVGEFTRFYTRFVVIFQAGYLGARFSVTQARIIYEVARNGGVTASRLAKSLGVDSGYLSRILSGFERDGLLQRSRSKQDRRQWTLELTSAGKREFKVLNSRTQTQIEDALRALTPGQQTDLIRAMRIIERFLGGPPHASVMR